MGNKYKIMFDKFIDFLKQHDLYDEEIFKYYWDNTFMFDYIDDELRRFIGCSFILDGNNCLKGIMACAPFIEDDRTVLINIHEYVHVLLMYPYIGKKCDIGRDIEVLAIFYEKLYVLENNNPELDKYSNYLDSKIYYTNEKEYVLGLALRDKLNRLYDKGYSVKKLEKTAKRLVKRELIKSGINELKNRVTKNNT